MTLTPEIIAAIGTSIITPIIAYLKVKGDTSKRTEKRNDFLTDDLLNKYMYMLLSSDVITYLK